MKSCNLLVNFGSMLEPQCQNVNGVLPKNNKKEADDILRKEKNESVAKSTKHPRHNGVLIFTSGALGGSCADSSRISCSFGGAPGALRGRSWRPKRPKSSQNVTFIVKFGFLGSGEHPSEATSQTIYHSSALTESEKKRRSRRG